MPNKKIDYQKLTSLWLKKMHLFDQKRRFEIVAKWGSKMAESKDKTPYFEFKGECEERDRLVLFLIKNNALKNRDDFYYAAFIIINSGLWKNYVLSYRLIKKYRELGGRKGWGFYEGFFKKQDWGKTKEQAENEIEKMLGVHPRELIK